MSKQKVQNSNMIGFLAFSIIGFISMTFLLKSIFLSYSFVVFALVCAGLHQSYVKNMIKDAAIFTHFLSIMFASLIPVTFFWEFSEKSLTYSLVILALFATEFSFRIFRKNRGGIWFYSNPKLSIF